MILGGSVRFRAGFFFPFFREIFLGHYAGAAVPI
uniref:Uncharacterized protein n=1 Tax=Arundo donax TaxID=35708 RepID=A0A0A9U7Q6_ARUDO